MCIVKFMFDYGADSCIWAVNHYAVNQLGEGIIPLNKMAVSDALKRTIEDLCEEYDSFLNWENPTAGTTWTVQHIESFRTRALDAYRALVNELGEGFEVQNFIDMCLEN